MKLLLCKVVILVEGRTDSAAEDFPANPQASDNVTIISEPTSGSISTVWWACWFFE